MKRSFIAVLVIAAIASAGAYYMRRGSADAPAGPAAGGGGGQFGGFGGFGPGGGRRPPMTVEVASVTRADMAQRITVVGNLIGAATVSASPKINGRLASVSVRMGDRVGRGQPLAKIEDSELLEQVKQAEASFGVSAATIRQRQADLKFAQTNLDRSRNLFDRQLIPKQTLDDAEARHQAATAQLDLASAQHQQAQARLDELKINLANTVIASPVTGFVASRSLDPGAWVTPNSVFMSVVDISTVRLVAGVIERDVRRIEVGLPAEVEVDAYPGEKFLGKVAHVAPVLDPATRTAQVEVDISNPDFRLKPGMYAKVNFTVDKREQTLVVPANAVVDLGEQRGVFLPADGDKATFHPVSTGLVDQNLIEVLDGLKEGDRIISTGAAALREGDPIVLPGADGRRGGGGGGGRGGRQGSGEARGQAPAGDRAQGSAPPAGASEGADGRGGAARESAPTLQRETRPDAGAAPGGGAPAGTSGTSGS
jgi:HlyD family secretion protein